MKAIHVTLAASIIAALPNVAAAEHIQANLTGYQEVPSVSTPASGTFDAKIANDDESFSYELTFSGLVGSVQQSHIHIAQPAVNGSIVVWLCQTATTLAPPAVTAITPPFPIAGTASQQITAGELDEVIAAIRAGVAYVNVHATPLNPGGEIRGQIKASNQGGQ